MQKLTELKDSKQFHIKDNFCIIEKTWIHYGYGICAHNTLTVDFFKSCFPDSGFLLNDDLFVVSQKIYMKMIPFTLYSVAAWTHLFANKAVRENVRTTHSSYVKLSGLKQRVNNGWTDGFKLGRTAEHREKVLERTTGRK